MNKNHSKNPYSDLSNEVLTQLPQLILTEMKSWELPESNTIPLTTDPIDDQLDFPNIFLDLPTLPSTLDSSKKPTPNPARFQDF